MDIAWKEEELHLDFTRKEMKEVLEQCRKIFATLEQKYRDEPRLLENMMSLYATRIRGIEMSLEKPYFARIDFLRTGEEKARSYYIGKIGLPDRANDPLITDWRAPISSLYYGENLGPASYTAPGGAISGVLERKRQILIESGLLKDVFDVDSVSDDELLRPYLNASMESRLKNIVASIQKEQNDIIRRPLYQSIVVQGVAGSGKTTVALHRIAYLVYNYREQLAMDQFLVIGPNRFFLSYISNVLPDLDVGGAHQLTYEELAADFIGERFQVENPARKVAGFLSGNPVEPYLAFQSSLDYRDALSRFFSQVQEEFFDEEGLVVNGVSILSREEILNRCNGYPADNLERRLEMTMQSLAAHLKDSDDVSERIRCHFSKLSAETREEVSKNLTLQMDTLEKQKRGFLPTLKKYLSLKGIKVLPLYRRFMEQIESWAAGQPSDMLQKMKEDVLPKLEKKKVCFEDLPALLYLKFLLSGNEKFRSFAHTVVDEAQDFGLFHLDMLTRLLEKSSFSIFGDLTQGIYGHHSIRNWEEVARQVFAGKCEILQMEKSYRTTIQIMEAANRISRYLGLPEGRPVIRNGDPVSVIPVTAGERISKLAERIAFYRERGYRSIAAICKTGQESEHIWKELNRSGVSIERISEENEEYSGQTCVITCTLAKGLEFDAVVICDADRTVYSGESPLDMKLLYVAMTRALHHLELFTTGGLPTVLDGITE